MDNWKSFQVLKKGSSHEAEDKDCQDFISIKENENSIIAALADGLGSLDYSQEAAKTVTETVCNFFSVNSVSFSEEGISKTKKNLVDDILFAVSDRAKDLNISMHEMNCTLVFVAVFMEEEKALVGHVGDSVICIINDDGSRAITDRSISANSTNVIIEDDVLDIFDVQVIDLSDQKTKGFILSSDGLENELYMKGSSRVLQNAELYFNAVSQAADCAEAKISDRLNYLTNDPESSFIDDISLAILCRTEELLKLPSDPTWLCDCGTRNSLKDTYCVNCHKDFIDLYKNIRFRDYGGKATFFENINKTPEKEYEIIGLVSNIIATDDKSSKGLVENYTDSPSEKKKPSFIQWLFGNKEKQGQIPPLKKAENEIVDGQQATSENNSDNVEFQERQCSDKSCFSAPFGNHLEACITADGKDFWGALNDNGKPEGRGILIVDNQLFIGSYIDGVKDGQFLIIDADLKSDLSYAVYNGGKIICKITTPCFKTIDEILGGSYDESI